MKINPPASTALWKETKIVFYFPENRQETHTFNMKVGEEHNEANGQILVAMAKFIQKKFDEGATKWKMTSNFLLE